ncbi:MAG: 3-phosphoshikimate 1-carboxyvinyltransferase, partial [Pseudonocardiaceae bacterium]
HTTVTGPAQLRSPGEVVMRDISDTMMTLAAIAPFADAPVLIRDVANCRVKECDRIDAITTALNACGIATRTGPDWLEITPGEPCDRVIGGTVIDCHADHRIAMASSVLSLRAPGLQLNDPSCVAKTFPGFHEELARVVAQWQQTTS